MALLWVAAWTIILLIPNADSEYARVTSYDLMKCSYGERGSLTATCVNATPNFFKSTLYKFDHLDETLRCLNCTLTTIESNTFDLSGNQIKILDLENSAIETLKPKAFMGLIFLNKLNLANNKIRSIFPGTFNGAKKITQIDLTRNEITILSEDGFAELTNLDRLLLPQNKIKVIDPRAFRGLSNLRELDLRNNYIEAINSSLENVTSLEFVNLNNNRIKHLSGNEFFNISNLTKLDFSSNLLADGFAINMNPTNRLREINLSRNQINTLWFQTLNLDCLEILDLKSNNISVIKGNRLETMYGLHTLDLSHNKLEKVRTGQLSGLPQLRFLNISYNLISEVAVTGIFSFQNLQSLDLSHNKILDLDYTALLSRIPGLSYLRLEDNELSCDLEEEMENEFAEDNFKFVLFDNAVGSQKCVQKPLTKKTLKTLHDVHIEMEHRSISGADIFIFVMLTLIITAIGILFYLQYLFYKGIELTGPRRVASTVQLISTENDPKDDDFVEC